MSWGQELRRRIAARRYRNSRFNYLFEAYAGDEYISLDMETTSLDPKSARILSIGAVPIRGQQILSSRRFDIKLNAPKEMHAENILIHKLRPHDLRNQMDDREAILSLLRYIGTRPLVGYYVQFDLAVLNRYCHEIFGFRLVNASHELSQMYIKKVRRAYPDMHVDARFETIAEKLDLPIFDRHSAYGDALCSALMFVRLEYGACPQL